MKNTLAFQELSCEDPSIEIYLNSFESDHPNMHRTLLNLIKQRFPEKTLIELILIIQGTKKIAADFLAFYLCKNLKLNLTRINSEVYSEKYIGETEKNLDWLSPLKKHSGILLFDEADALFGRLNSAHNRYANQEVSYLKDFLSKYKGPVLFYGKGLKVRDFLPIQKPVLKIKL